MWRTQNMDKIKKNLKKFGKNFKKIYHREGLILFPSLLLFTPTPKFSKKIKKFKGGIK